jgi:hypothetical protein
MGTIRAKGLTNPSRFASCRRDLLEVWRRGGCIAGVVARSVLEGIRRSGGQKKALFNARILSV